MRLAALLALAGALHGCGAAAPAVAPAAPPVDAAAVTAAIGAVLDDWHDAAAHGDFDRYFGHFSDGGIFLGTDATERWTVQQLMDYSREPFADGEGWVFRSARRDVVVDDGGLIAWFDEDLDTEKLGPCRGSGVMVREGDAWKIAHYNLTVTVPNDRFREVRELLGQP